MTTKEIFNIFHPDYLNPFAHLTDDAGIHPRRRRIDFWKKTNDMIYILAGTAHAYTPFFSKKIKTGIFDWCTLHIRTLITLIKIASREAIRNAGLLNILLIWILLPLYLVSALAQFVLNIVFLVASMAVTSVTALLFILPIHLINLHVTKNERNALDKEFQDFFKTDQKDKGKKTVDEILDNQYAREYWIHYKGVDIETVNTDNYQGSSFEQDTLIKRVNSIKENCLSVVTNNDGIIVRFKNKEFAKYNTPEDFQKSNLFFFDLQNIRNKVKACNSNFTLTKTRSTGQIVGQRIVIGLGLLLAGAGVCVALMFIPVVGPFLISAAIVAANAVGLLGLTATAAATPFIVAGAATGVLAVPIILGSVVAGRREYNKQSLFKSNAMSISSDETEKQGIKNDK